jgi:hypothetical protein
MVPGSRSPVSLEREHRTVLYCTVLYCTVTARTPYSPPNGQIDIGLPGTHGAVARKRSKRDGLTVAPKECHRHDLHILNSCLSDGGFDGLQLHVGGQLQQFGIQRVQKGIRQVVHGLAGLFGRWLLFLFGSLFRGGGGGGGGARRWFHCPCHGPGHPARDRHRRLYLGGRQLQLKGRSAARRSIIRACAGPACRM